MTSLTPLNMVAAHAVSPPSTNLYPTSLSLAKVTNPPEFKAWKTNFFATLLNQDLLNLLLLAVKVFKDTGGKNALAIKPNTVSKLEEDLRKLVAPELTEEQKEELARQRVARNVELEASLLRPPVRPRRRLEFPISTTSRLKRKIDTHAALDEISKKMKAQEFQTSVRESNLRDEKKKSKDDAEKAAFRTQCTKLWSIMVVITASLPCFILEFTPTQDSLGAWRKLTQFYEQREASSSLTNLDAQFDRIKYDVNSANHQLELLRVTSLINDNCDDFANLIPPEIIKDYRKISVLEKVIPPSIYSNPCIAYYVLETKSSTSTTLLRKYVPSR
jgi:hypothetical protein